MADYDATYAFSQLLTNLASAQPAGPTFDASTAMSGALLQLQSGTPIPPADPQVTVVIDPVDRDGNDMTANPADTGPVVVSSYDPQT